MYILCFDLAISIQNGITDIIFIVDFSQATNMFKKQQKEI